MKAKRIPDWLPAAFLIIAILTCMRTDTEAQQQYSFKESFEGANPVKSWTSNAKFTLNYFGTTAEKVSDGTKSLKMDITVNGDGDKECYYYWQLPVGVNLHGELTFSADIWMDSETAKYAKIGYAYSFPPTGLETVPYPASVTEFGKWYRQSCIISEDVLLHAEKISKQKIYGSVSEDFGRTLKSVPILIKAKGQHRLVFYIDNIVLKGSVLSDDQFNSSVNTAWNGFQTRLQTQMKLRHSQYSTLPVIPPVTGIILSPKAKELLSKLSYSASRIPVLFSQMDGKPFFAPPLMDSLDQHLGMYASLVEMLKSELSSPNNRLLLFSMPPTVHNRLTGTNIPSGLKPLDKMKIRMTAGEYEPMSIFLQPRGAINDVRFKWSAFTGSAGILPASIADMSVVKVWYQAGVLSTETTGKILTQELLVKDDELVKVDYNSKTNYLKVTDKSGNNKYIDISSPGAPFPADVKVSDSKELLPVDLDGTTNRQIWITIHMPETAQPGIYTAVLTVMAEKSDTIASVPIEIEVLPFKLTTSRLTYSIYYHGFLDNSATDPYGFTGKTEAQLKTELNDLKAHGVLYPTTYQTLAQLQPELKIRNDLNFPKDKLFALGLSAGNPQSPAELSSLKSKVTQWKTQAAQSGYQDVYIYGIDEAKGDLLKSQRPAWNAVHEAGGKVFVAGYTEMHKYMGDILDVGVILGDLRKEQAALYHSTGKKIFSYSNPQAGQENPEIYRRNYGLALWKAGYDGAMDYAYQKFYKNAWNDFDDTQYREETFTYPASSGIISTIQWEGFREGVDDVRYLSTLLDITDKMKLEGNNTDEISAWINSIDPSMDLDNIRGEIIDKILLLTEGSSDNGHTSTKPAVTPKTFELMQNYPNPFNPSTTIKFAIPERGEVELKVYDILGREVVSLIKEVRGAGTYQIVFNAANLASGTYIYHLKCGDFTESKKMQLIK